jgi:hypothetical protein
MIIIYKISVIKDGEVRNIFYYTSESLANKTMSDSILNGYEVTKEITELSN